MPQLGYDMTEATLIRWLKREGDSVVVDEVIAEIETDKAIVELGSTAAGALQIKGVPDGRILNLPQRADGDAFMLTIVARLQHGGWAQKASHVVGMHHG